MPTSTWNAGVFPWRLALGTLAAIWACAPALKPVPPSTVTLRNYEAGGVRTASIGDAIFDVQRGHQQPLYEAVRSFTTPRPRLFGTSHEIQSGQLFRLTAELPDKDLLILTGPDRLPYPIAIDSTGAVQGWTDALTGRIFGGDWPEGSLFSPTREVSAGEGAFRAQLIYSGMDGQTLKAVYREFAGDFIRPAFTQELQYDLSTSHEIGYKSIRVEVLDASNAQVRYRVVSDGGLEWLPL